MNLSEALTGPPPRNVKTWRCLFGRYIDSLDTGDTEQVEAALNDYAWTNKVLHERLASAEPRWFGSQSLLGKHRAGDCACRRGADAEKAEATR